METKFQTSFIPKKPIVEEQRSGSGLSLFLLIPIIIFLVSLGLMGWVYMQKKILVQKISETKISIDERKSSFEPETIESVLRLDSRIKVGNQLLAGHVSVSRLFSFLETATLKNIRFKNFHFSKTGLNETGQNIMKIEMAGQARDFKTVAVEAQEFGKLGYRTIIKESVFSDLNLSQDGSVTFSFAAKVVPDFILYSKTKEI